MKLPPLRIHCAGCFETLNLLHESSCKMFTLCDVLQVHEIKLNAKQTLENAQYMNRNRKSSLRLHHTVVDKQLRAQPVETSQQCSKRA